jgi:tetratricopeptide (TPR) repeat protein
MPRYGYQRINLIVGTVVMIFIAGVLISLLPTQPRLIEDVVEVEGQISEPKVSRPDIENIDLEILFLNQAGLTSPDKSRDSPVRGIGKEVRWLFDESSNALLQGDFNFAVESLKKIKEIQPALPAVSINLGFAYVGLEQYTDAADEFQRALQLAPAEPTAYYGLALVYEHRNQLDLAVSSMKTFIHLAPQEHAFRRKAESAVWEWESSMQSTDSNQ